MANQFHEYYHVATDDTFRETLRHGKESYPFAYYFEDVWQFDFHCVDWHWHHEVEFLLVTKGELICLIGEERIELPEGFGLFVNSGILHRYEAAKGSVIVPNIVFSPTFIAAEESLIYAKYVFPILNSTIPYQIFSPQIEWQNQVLETLLEIYDLQECSRVNELQTARLTMKMWNVMFENMDIVMEISVPRRANQGMAKLQVMMQYIHDHYREQITLEEIASAVSISKSSALNIFRAGIHISPVSYLIQYRLKCAGKLLHTTEKSVSDIAEDVGFSAAGYFCRKFKEYYHVSPNEYRRKNG